MALLFSSFTETCETSAIRLAFQKFENSKRRSEAQ